MKCKVCGKNAESEYCFRHKPGKRMKKARSPVKKEVTNEMRDFFLSIWNERPHYSELSYEPLGTTPLSTMFHHIILKSDPLYGKKGRYDKENIILLTPDEHTRVHSDMYVFDKINVRRELLLKKYNTQ